MSARDGGYAFPSPGVVLHESTDLGLREVHQGAYSGMTLRDFFAKGAMEGLLAEAPTASGESTWAALHRGDKQALASSLARAAFLVADAMVAARSA